jgi:diguanylate cyclase (GGDEF)-like protein/PAS domain S-box-containing protein
MWNRKLSDFLSWPPYNGDMAAWIRTHDWAATPLGPIQGWPQNLKAAVDMVLQMTVPAIVSWGSDGILINNDACLPLVRMRRAPSAVTGEEESWPDSEAFRSRMRRVRTEDTGMDCPDQQLRAMRPDGSIEQAWFTINYSPLHDEEGHAAGALAIFFDTTDRVLAEMSLRDSERQLSAIFAGAQVGLSLISLEGKFLRVNDELCRILGRPRSTLLDMGIGDVTDAQDIEKSLEAVGRLITTGKSESIEKRYLRPDGQLVPANSIISRLDSGPGPGYQILAVTVDLTERQRAADALAESEARFRALAEASSALIWQLDASGSAIYINPRHQVLLGIPTEKLLGYGWSFILHPDERADTLHLIEDGIEKRVPVQRRLRIRFTDGQWHWMEAHAAPWFAANGEYAGHVGIALDIDDAVRAQQDLLVSNERLKLAIEGSGDGIWDWDLLSNRIDCSERAQAIMHLSGAGPFDPDCLLGELVHPEDQSLVKAEVSSCLGGSRTTFSVEFRIRTEEPGWRWILARGTVVSRDQQSELPQRMTGTFSDVTDKRRSEEIVWEHANFDLLTGLPNRRLFRDRLDHEIRKSQRSGQPLALLFIDLDRFKEANDLLGHTVGDQVLVESARRICACVRHSDTVARLGGDEFTVILTELDSNLHAEPIARKINETLSQPFLFGNEVVYLSASIGITLFPDDAADAENLIRNADQAMYVVKNEGRNHFSYFTPSMQREANERLRLISDLRVALRRNQLQVHYQPIIDLRSGRVAKAEALLRWLHPSMGMIEPVRFIAFAEETGLISEIGDWVFREAAACSHSWGRRIGAPFTVSVNKSPVQFISRLNEVNWPDHLKQMGMKGNSVSVEITEGVLLDASPSVSAKLLQYHDAGIKVAIDDFGTGYSSIAYLKKFEVDYLKIDQSFVRDIGASLGDRAIVRSIIAMAHELGLEVIAEGIETDEQKNFLIEGQCDFGQGFLFSKAVPAPEFEQMLIAEV